MRDRFEGLGIDPMEIPTALILFNGMLWLEWAAMLGFCMRVRPLRTALRTSSGRRLRDRVRVSFPSLLNAETYVLDKALQAAQSRWFRGIPGILGQTPRGTTRAFAYATLSLSRARSRPLSLSFPVQKRTFLDPAIVPPFRKRSRRRRHADEKKRSIVDTLLMIHDCKGERFDWFFGSARRTETVPEEDANEMRSFVVDDVVENRRSKNVHGSVHMRASSSVTR